MVTRSRRTSVRTASALGVSTLVLSTVALSTLLLPGVAGADDDYVVSEGETLSHIAVRTGNSIAALQLINDIEDPNAIFSGQRLRTDGNPAAGATYTVVSGDTLSEIAVRVGASVDELTALNDLGSEHRIRVGLELVLPVGSTLAAPAVDPARYPGLPQRILDNPERLALIPVFEKWAAANDLPADLLMATAWHESGWNQDAESWAGAVGVGQLMPITAEWVAATLIGQPDLDRFIAEDNIRMSARFLDWLLDRNDGDVRLALGSYFQGPTSVRNGEWLDATENYVQNVEAQRARFMPVD